MILLLGLIVLVGVGVALSVWKTKTEQGNRRAAEQLIARHTATVDSLTALADSLRERAQVTSAGEDTMFIFGMMRQIDTLRAQVLSAVESVRRTSGVDSISFYLRMLRDSSFYSQYGDYSEPKRWYIAPEWFGQLGADGLAPLISHLEATSGFERTQTLYALLLASQHESVSLDAQRDLPVDAANQDSTSGAVIAWQRWGSKWGYAK